jgi:CheY-like chemotaxis protein
MLDLRVLYVDDSLMARKVVGEYLEENVTKVVIAEDGEDALKEFTNQKFELLITDIKMPNKDGISLVSDAKQIDPTIKIVIISAYKGEKEQEECRRLGVFEFLEKPLDLDKLIDTLNRASKLD